MSEEEHGKSRLKSKTMWLNAILVAVSAVMAFLTDQIPQETGAAGMAIGIGNMVLREITKDGVGEHPGGLG